MEQMLAGKRTYLIVLVALGYLAGIKFEWWPADEQIVAALGFAAVAFLRASVNKPAPVTPPAILRERDPSE